MQGESTLLGTFLAKPELRELERFANAIPWWCWKHGRQNTGYGKMDLGRLFLGFGHEEYSHPVARAWELLERPDQDKMDAYILHYPHRSFVPPHKDPAPEGFIHRRLNAIVQLPTVGGAFRLNGSKIDIPRGGAIIFNSSEEEHSVDDVLSEQPRIVLSVGCLLPKTST